MSEVKVNKISPRSGTGVQLGDSGDTITIPAGATINNQGTATNFGATGSASWTTTVKTADFTAVAGEGYFVNTTSGSKTVTLPAGVAGAVVAFKDYADTFDTNALVLTANGSDKIGGSTDDKRLSTEGIAATLIFIDSTKGWLVTDDGLQSTVGPLTYSADFLVIAGGGSGGNDGGGGGAGGYRTSTQAITPGASYTVTVGDGGAAGSIGTQNNGSNSSISGTGITTITSAGGGAGGFGQSASYQNGTNGGSGGGGGSTGSGTNNGAGGSGNTPSTSPSQGNNGGTGKSDNAGYRAGGGGGGAGAVGENSSTPAQSNNDKGGAGGAGTASSITGSSVTRAGGGGGRSGTAYASPGGAGGGGNGGGSLTASAGTANTGGGGGSAKDASSGNAGGSGVVILSIPDADYSGTTTGSPTVATGVSGKTVLTFNGDGSYTG